MSICCLGKWRLCVAVLLGTEETSPFVAETESSGEHLLLEKELAPYTDASVLLFKYQVSVQHSQEVCPILLTAIWQNTPDSVNLMIRYQLNHFFLQPFNVENFKIVVCCKGDEAVGSVQTQPIGNWDLDLRTLVWDLNDVDGIYEDQEEKMIIAKIETTGTEEPEPVLVAIRLSQALVSGIDVLDPSIQMSLVKDKVVISGTFAAESEYIK